MLTIRKIIEAADAQRDNCLPQREKIRWLCDLDQEIYEEILLTHEGTESIETPIFPYVADSVVLLLPDRFAAIYEMFLCSKIDYRLGEIEQYENDHALFEESYRRFRSFYNERHLPRCQAEIKVAPQYHKG